MFVPEAESFVLLTRFYKISHPTDLDTKITFVSSKKLPENPQETKPTNMYRIEQALSPEFWKLAENFKAC